MHEHMSFYKILHISEDAPDEIIKLAYKGLAQKYHPDRYKGPDANDHLTNFLNVTCSILDICLR